MFDAFSKTTQSLIDRIKELERENEYRKQILKKLGIDYSAADVNDSATEFGLVWN